MRLKSFVLYLVGCGMALAAGASQLPAQDARSFVSRSIENRQASYARMALDIWDYAEVGYQEEKSSARLCQELKQAGFSLKEGVAEIPTAFIAEYGQGRPVIAILAEFDALPGMSQEAVPERRPIPGREAGHGCGHHLFGSASTAAAIAVKEWLAESGNTGTIRLYGTPAEEGGAGKVYLVRAGLFSDVDATLAWHPGDRNDASPRKSLANVSAKFRFYGTSSHAAGAPEKGRSALDGVEAMDYMVNLMREHVPSEARIHYVITNGGEAPNVVPDFAEVYYYCRHPEVSTVLSMLDWIVKASEGAAMGTQTRVEHERIHGLYSLLSNEHLGRLLDANLRQVGGVRYSAEELAFAKKIQPTLPTQESLDLQEEVLPWTPRTGGGSTDVADVSWVVPTAQFTAATWVPGTPSHSWQAVAAGGTSIGAKGMIVAAKTLALTAVDLLSNPAHVAEARKELEKAQGPGFKYQALVGDRKPPLDYREKR